MSPDECSQGTRVLSPHGESGELFWTEQPSVSPTAGARVGCFPQPFCKCSPAKWFGFSSFFLKAFFFLTPPFGLKCFTSSCLLRDAKTKTKTEKQNKKTPMTWFLLDHISCVLTLTFQLLSGRVAGASYRNAGGLINKIITSKIK